MSILRKRKTTKLQFQRDLIKLHGLDNLSARKYKDEVDIDDYGTPIYKTLTLYYSNDTHCATWCEGEGWEFEVNEVQA